MSVESVALAVFAAQIFVLLACMGVVLNVLVRRADAVLYREGVLLFAVTLGLLSVGASANFAYDFGLAESRLVVVASYVLYVAASACLVAAAAYFARDFVETARDRTVPEDGSADTGGFEDA
ncbi:hypothetical protein [Salarchaeum sp. JOR-1]|uniref:hypothetical protein n=1 Tax=Salarchaeum sp. JOR-1 TaxID=2599399 RepID=UPI0011989877|nr:hypothetical protein [Salarchaeum sp. JOR-1]QDX41251.1 hypothetical protein FQU85_10215 [Salarchaeum sp. JOR-1]